MDKFMQQMREAFANEALWKEFQTGIWDTIYSTVAATLVACVLGIILGIILVAGEEDGVRPLPGPVMKVLNFAINILRSVPFLILMIMVLPLSELLVGTTIGTVASIPPLIIASASFLASLIMRFLSATMFCACCISRGRTRRISVAISSISVQSTRLFLPMGNGAAFLTTSSRAAIRSKRLYSIIFSSFQ